MTTLAPLRPKAATKCWCCGQGGVHRTVDQCIASLKVAVSRARIEYPFRAREYARLTKAYAPKPTR